MSYTLHIGDCLDVLRTLPANSVDAIVTDPPYGLAFMGKRWDYDVPSVEIWTECLRVLKPGGHLLAFAGTRTQHRMAVRIEDAGFEIRDMIAWVYGSGFPKSLDVSKAIDKVNGAEREVLGTDTKARSTSGKSALPTMGGDTVYQSWNITAPATPAARQWAGWGTALKPALEPVTVARKPLIGTVAANVLAHGTGALNVDGCRIAGEPFDRWPHNLIHDGSAEVVGLFPTTADGPSARFFYCPKASKADRDHGCDALPKRTAAECVDRTDDSAGMDSPRAGAGRTLGSRNHHPTVKPTDLMRYLCRLVTPPGGTVLDPFVGSGSTGRGAVLEGFDFVGIDRDPEYLAIAEARIAAAVQLRAEELDGAAREAARPQQLALF